MSVSKDKLKSKNNNVLKEKNNNINNIIQSPKKKIKISESEYNKILAYNKSANMLTKTNIQSYNNNKNYNKNNNKNNNNYNMNIEKKQNDVKEKDPFNNALLMLVLDHVYH